MELMTVKDIMDKYNCTINVVRNRIARNGLKPAGKLPAQQHKGSTNLYNPEEVEKAFTSTAAPRRKELWKLSVFDFKLEHFIVRRVSLSKEEAKKLLKERRAAGDVARITPHVKKGA